MKHVNVTRPMSVRPTITLFLAWLALGFAAQWVHVATGALRSNVFLFLFMVGSAGVITFALVLHRVLLRRRLASAELTVDNATTKAGEPVRFRLELRARRPVVIEKVVAVLTCAQEAPREAVLPVVVARVEKTVAENLRLGRGETAEVAGEIVPTRASGHWRLDTLTYTGRHLASRLHKALGRTA